MSHTSVCVHVAWVVALLSACAHAPPVTAMPPPGTCALLRPIPPPAAFYGGADEDARATRFDPADEHAFAELDQRVRANPDDVDARIARGYAHARRGSRALSEADYRRAWQLAPYRTRIGWSEGWALFSLGDPVCAVHAWERAGALQGGNAFWLPYTLAVGYWAAGEKDIAVGYYYAAARSAPQRFGSVQAADDYSGHWQPDERLTLHEIAMAAFSEPAARRFLDEEGVRDAVIHTPAG